MTVEELVKELKKYPNDSVVIINGALDKEENVSIDTVWRQPVPAKYKWAKKYTSVVVIG